MSKAQILVICSAPSGYRRGGVALDQGDNVFEHDQFSEEQLLQLEEDPRLKVGLFEGDPEPGANSEAAGTVDADRLAELVKHIASLDKDDSKLWKEDGTPKATAYPKGTTSEERAAAWNAFVAQQDGAE